MTHPSRHLAHSIRSLTSHVPDPFRLVPLALAHSKVALRLVLEIAVSHAVVSAILVLDDLPPP